MTQLEELLSYLHEIRGSDLHLKPGAVPHVRVDGQLKATPFEVPGPGVVEALASSILDAARQDELATTGETSSGFSVAGLGRFRVAVHRQRGSLAMVVRRVPPEIPDLDELGLPPQVERFAEEEQRPGAGHRAPRVGQDHDRRRRCIDRINRERSCHILTIEDPIEVLHADAQAIVTQREVGSDTAGYAAALRTRAAPGRRRDLRGRAARRRDGAGRPHRGGGRAPRDLDDAGLRRGRHRHPARRPVPRHRAGPGPPVPRRPRCGAS